MKNLIVSIVFAVSAWGAQAQDMITYTTDQPYEDVVFGLENAILDQGLVVDSISHVGEMLERTKADVGSDITIFLNADVYSFCSAAVSRRVMEVNPMNIIHCPYGILIARVPSTPDQTMIGYRTFPAGEMQEVQALLDTIAKSAIGQE